MREDMDQPLPRLCPDTEFFWTSGADGQLRFMTCMSCGRICHPPTSICRNCRSRELEPRIVSGLGTVWSFSVVHQPFIDWIETPYVVAIIAIAEDPAVHLTTRIVGCPPEDVHIDMPVRVQFEQHGDIYLPLFTPNGDG